MKVDLVPDLTIHSDSPNSNQVQIALNGVAVPHCKRITINLDADEVWIEGTMVVDDLMQHNWSDQIITDLKDGRVFYAEVKIMALVAVEFVNTSKEGEKNETVSSS